MTTYEEVGQDGLTYIVTERDGERISVSPKPDNPNPNVNKITNLEFWDRFEETEKEDLCDHASKKAKKFLYELRIRKELDLTNDKLIADVNAMVTASIISPARATEILAPAPPQGLHITP